MSGWVGEQVSKWVGERLSERVTEFKGVSSAYGYVDLNSGSENENPTVAVNRKKNLAASNLLLYSGLSGSSRRPKIPTYVFHSFLESLQENSGTLP